jgi:hypothetical protein
VLPAPCPLRGGHHTSDRLAQAKHGMRTRAMRERQLEPQSARACQAFAKQAKKNALAGISRKPSDGLEPSTASLPWKFRRGNGVHARSFASTFVLQINRSVVSAVPARDRAWSRSCTRLVPAGVLSVLKTRNVTRLDVPWDRQPGWRVAMRVQAGTKGQAVDRQTRRDPGFRLVSEGRSAAGPVGAVWRASTSSGSRTSSIRRVAATTPQFRGRATYVRPVSPIQVT